MLRLLVLGLGLFAVSAAVTALALGLAVGLLVVLVVTAPALGREHGTAAAVALFAAGVPVAFVAAVAAHEAGHLVAGEIAGLAPRFAHVGPVTFTRERGRWATGWDWQQPWWGGRVACDRPAPGRWREAAFLLAGPAANLAAGLLAAPLVVAADLSAWPRCWAGLFAAQSLFLAGVNLVPLTDRRLASDGLALWRLLTRRPPA